MIHPYVSNKTGLSIYALIWSIVALIHAFALIYFIDINIGYAILDSVVFNLIYFVLGLALWYPTNFINFESSKSSVIFINHLFGAFITSGLWIGVGYFILTHLYFRSESYYNFLYNSLVWRFFIGLLIYSIIVSINYLSIYYNNFREKLKQESELNSLIKEAELKSLKYQINPHFIFNSLNSISSLTISNPDKAREMTIKLSTFLRSTLSKNEKQKNQLSEELQNIKLYLEIEKIRFDDKFDFVESLSDECRKIEVPNMLLQPLFENAIKHGVYESLEKVIIKLACIQEEKYLKVVVTNNFDPDAAPRKGEGIGLQNIKNRLKLFYNQDNLLRVKKEKDQFKVTIFIPLEEN